MKKILTQFVVCALAVALMAPLAQAQAQPARLRRLRVELLYRLVAVRGQIAKIFDQLGLDEDFLADSGLERRA